MQLRHARDVARLERSHASRGLPLGLRVREGAFLQLAYFHGSGVRPARVAMNFASRAMDRKLSSSRSSREIFTPNSFSSASSRSTNASESRLPVSNRSTSNEG